MKTVEEVAKELGRTKPAITIALKNMGYQKIAGVYLIDDKTFEILKASKGAGRPKGAKNKAK